MTHFEMLKYLHLVKVEFKIFKSLKWILIKPFQATRADHGELYNFVGSIYTC